MKDAHNLYIFICFLIYQIIGMNYDSAKSIPFFVVREHVMWNQIKDLGLNVRPESERTLRKYGNQRRFKNEYNKNEIFSYHFDMPRDSRAYLKEVIEEKKIFIANIVSHLDTVQG